MKWKIRTAFIFLWLAVVPALVLHATEEVAADQQFWMDYLSKTETLQARFTQVAESADGKQRRSAGELWIKKPGKFRWQYDKPFVQIFVADGSQVFDYDPDLEQLIIYPQDETLSGSPAAVLSGQTELLDLFSLQGTFKSGETQWLEFAAKLEDAEFPVVRIGFSGAQMTAMELTSRIESSVRIEFEITARNHSLDASIFKLDVPESTEVVNNLL